jgi:hypothetical protein
MLPPWRYAIMTDWIQLRLNGPDYQVHRRGLKLWEHPVGEPYQMDGTKKLPCPVCDKEGKQ